MELAIISHTPHYKGKTNIVGWGPTVREIDQLATLFDRVVHVAPLYDDPPPESAIPYSSSHVVLAPVRPAGGGSLSSKLAVLARIPGYVPVILRNMRKADVVHVRCPANISLVAVLLLAFADGPRSRWIKYAGNWQQARGEAWSYKLQRLLLRWRFHGAQVTVNGDWPDQPRHIHPFLNPCLTEKELEEGRAAAENKGIALPVRLLYAGRLEDAKGVGRLLDIVAHLAARRLPAALDIIGDGPDRRWFQRRADSYGISTSVNFHGWLPRTEIAPYYARAHMAVFPSNSSEGWPKVLSEAMAYGAVPIAGAVSSIPQYLGRFRTGRAIDPRDTAAFAEAILDYVSNPERWKEESRNAVRAARSFSYSNYLLAVQELLNLHDLSSAPRRPGPVPGQTGVQEKQTTSCT